MSAGNEPSPESLRAPTRRAIEELAALHAADPAAASAMQTIRLAHRTLSDF